MRGGMSRRVRYGLSRLGFALIAILILAAAAGGFLLMNKGGGGASPPATTATTPPPGGGGATTTTTTTGAGEEKVLRIGIGIDADTLFPASQTTTTISNIVKFFAEPLFTINEEGKIVPLLAENYSVSDDGLTYTVRLKRGIRFQDGTPLNATAVKFTFEKILDPNIVVPQRGYYKVIESVEVIDEYTVEFRLKYPYAPFLGLLASEAAAIISPTAFNKLGDKVFTEPRGLGTGPFQFQEWVRGERIVLVRNENYWGQKPYFDKIIFYIIPDAQTREAKLLSGELDLIMQPPATDIQRLENTPGIKVLKGLSTRAMYIGINTLKGPLADKRVRQALNYAIDKEALVENVLFGLGKVMDSPLPDYVIGHEKLGPYPYDPDKARQLLAEAGYPNGFHVKLYTPVGRYLFDKELAQAIAQYLRQVGIDAEVVPVADWPTYVQMILAPANESQLELFLLGWAPTVPDPHFYLYPRFHSSQWPPNGFNDFFYSNPEVDRLLDEGVKTLDPQLRQEIYANASRLIWEDAPNIFLHLQYLVIAQTDRLEGVKLLPNEMFDVAHAWFKD